MGELLRLIIPLEALLTVTGKREYGDFQTPPEFAEKVCSYLKDILHLKPATVLEPTCGVGNFLKASSVLGAKNYFGIEVNSEYCSLSRQALSGMPAKVVNADIFSFPLGNLIKDNRELLILGNPPWVTTPLLAVLNSSNVPARKNFKKMRGIDALTGAGAFDISEAVILRLADEFCASGATMCFLCKTGVARDVFVELRRRRIGFSYFQILNFNAQKVFGVSVAACVMVFRLSATASSSVCDIFDFSSPSLPSARLEWDGQVLRGQKGCANLDGRCELEWREGVKHDCSKIMELSLNGGKLVNGLGEEVALEQDVIFPLVKSSGFKSPVISKFSKYVIVTQKNLQEDGRYLEDECPKAWAYLSSHSSIFRARKSSVYRRSTFPFSMFGVGKYSFAPYKVGISGFYKKPFFSLILPENGKPAMTDDTCYFLSFPSYPLAYTAMLLLNAGLVREFLKSVAFLDSKRPWTKKVLGGVSLEKSISLLDFSSFKEVEEELGLEPFINAGMIEDLKKFILADKLGIS